MQNTFFLIVFALAISACNQSQQYDTIIRNGTICDGNGGLTDVLPG